MCHECDRRCPIVREQLRKAQEEARKETPDEDSSSAGPSTGKTTKNGFSKRSKQSSKFPSGAASPTKTVGTPQASQHTLARGSPVRSQRRSKESQRSTARPLGRDEPGRSAVPSRTFDPDRGRNRRSHESELTITEQQTSIKKKSRRSPKSTRNGRYDADEYKTGSYSRSDSVQKIPDHSRGLKRGAAEKGERKRLEPDQDGQAGPSRRTRSRKEKGEEDEEEFEDYSPERSREIRKLKDEKEEMEADDYLLYKKLPYFGDLCNCCFRGLAKQLWNDRFFKSTVASVAVFALGLKLCRDLKGWTLPNPL